MLTAKKNTTAKTPRRQERPPRTNSFNFFSAPFLALLASWRSYFFFAGVCWCASNANAQAVGQFPGVTYREEVHTNPPLHLYCVQADLTNPLVHLRVCRAGDKPTGDGSWDTTLLQVSKIAQREHLDVAVNGSLFAPKDAEVVLGRKLPYFEGNWARACGWTVSDGQLWSPHPIAPRFPTLVIWKDKPPRIDNFPAVPAGAWQAVSGFAMLVRGGKSLGSDRGPLPRTAVGLDREDKTLTLLVVDGRRPDDSVGLTFKQMGDEMVKLGCDRAINLDSGGSSTLVIRNGQHWPVINRPSDGHDLPIPLSVERPVANALGIVVDENSTTQAGP
jgi:hypothetical protein